MAAITVTPANVRMIFPHLSEAYPAVAGVALTAGQLVHFNSSGKLILTDADSAGTALCDGVCLESCGAGQATSYLVRGFLAGLTVSALANRVLVYASDVAGGWDTAAGTVSLSVGRVIPMSDSSFTKVVYFFAPSFH